MASANPKASTAEQSIPPISLLGSSIVGALVGGIVIYALVARGPDGLQCFNDIWNVSSFVGGIAASVVTSLYFEYRARRPIQIERFFDFATAPDLGMSGLADGVFSRSGFLAFLVAALFGRKKQFWERVDEGD